MDPTGPAQPSLDTVYSTAGNPAEQTDQEKQSAGEDHGSVVEQREPVPSSHNEDPTPSSLGFGTQSSQADRHEVPSGEDNTEAEQMRAAGEGDVYKAQFDKTGFGEQDDLAADLDRKKEEQAGMREQVHEQRSGDVSVAGALGQRKGPAVVEGR